MKSILLFFVFGLLYCSTATQDVKVLAREECNCFKLLSDSIDDNFKLMMIKASKSKEPQKAIMEALNELSKTEKARFSWQMRKMDQTMTFGDSSLSYCFPVQENPYTDQEPTEVEKKQAKLLMKELGKLRDCGFFVAYLKLMELEFPVSEE